MKLAVEEQLVSAAAATADLQCEKNSSHATLVSCIHLPLGFGMRPSLSEWMPAKTAHCFKLQD